MRRITTLAAGVLLFAAAGLPVAAQTFPTNDPILRQIWDAGMNNSQTERLAQALLDSVGPRLTASPGHNAGNNWLAANYRAWGLAANIEPYGTWRGWKRGYSHIDLVTPRVRTLEGTLLAWSPGTGGSPVTAGTIILPLFQDSTQFVQWLPQAQGKFVMLSAPIPSCRPNSDWVTFGAPGSKTAIDSLEARNTRDWTARIRGTGYSFGLAGGALSARLDAAGVAGTITSRMTDGGQAGIGQAGTIAVFETYSTRSPGLALSCEDYGLIYRLTENRQNPTIRVNSDSELLGEVPVANAFGIIRGSEKPEEYVLLSSHFDSWDASSGATDNGTGTIVMLEAMRILKQVLPNPKRTIISGHWSSEEQGLNGSRAWAEDHPEIIRGLQATFNQDNGTGRIQRVSASGGLPAMAAHLEAWKAKMPVEFADTLVRYSASAAVPRSPGGTDGAVFACHGTPSFGLGALGWNYGSLTWHTNRDTYDKVVFDDLKRNATITAMLAYLASEDPQFISRTRTEGEYPDCGKAPRTTRAR